jgi:hypothetical protein
MPSFRLSRRAMLRGAAGGALVLPWLEILGADRASHAAALPARRFLSVYQPGGSVLDQWQPSGTQTDFTLSPMLRPLENVKDRILVLDGIDMQSAVGEQDQSGMVALLTGTPQITAGQFASGPSLDQVLATRQASGSAIAIPSLELAVRWGTGKSHGLLSPINCLNYRDTTAFEPIKPRLDPVATWNELFGGTIGTDSATWDRSMLDAVMQRYVKLSARLGAADKERLEAHLERLRELEVRVADVARCSAPELVDTSDYDPDSGLNSADDGSIKDLATDAAIPKVGKLMIDMLVMAFACDLTTVGTLQWSDCEAKHTFPWLGLPETHAFYQNDGGYHPEECALIGTWYCEQLAYLLTSMDAIDMGGHTLLDESVVFYGSHLQNVATHQKTNMPFILAGGGGGLRTGRFLQFGGRSHNDLLVSILNLFGDPRTTFGDAQYCDGPIVNLV